LESIVQAASFSRFGAQVVVQSSPPGFSITVDGVNYPSPQSFTWTTGSAHTIAAVDTQNGSAGIRYVWNNWNDGKPRLHSVTPLGRSFTYDGFTFTDPQTRTVIPGVEHFLGTTTPQPVTPFVLQYSFKNWSDGGAQYHSIFADSNTTYTAIFTTQYYLSLAAET